MPIRIGILCLIGAATLSCAGTTVPDDASTGSVEPTPVSLPGGDPHADFPALMATKVAAKPETMERQLALLEERYDLSDRPSPDAKMSNGKPIQQGVRVKLRPWVPDWQTLSQIPIDLVRCDEQFPAGFLPLPHPNQPEGGMVFPPSQIDETAHQTGRDLTRFDLDFDLPEQFLPEFPAPIYLTTRKELGDVSGRQVVTSDNFYELFESILDPKQLDGLRLLLTPFPQQQFNLTQDRRSEKPSQGVACFDCHVNGHSNAAVHLVSDIRPQALRQRVDTVSLRGVNVQQLFGSQRALTSVEDFTEFEQRAAYFDGDPELAIEKGASALDRYPQVQNMAEFQKLLDFPPAPKLALDGALLPASATPAELRGQALFHGKAQCASCHSPPYYTDRSLHDLKVERFYERRTINGRFATADGAMKTPALRGIKDSPPYLHDGRLLTLEDTIEFFNLVLQTQLSEEEKSDLLAFLYTL